MLIFKLFNLKLNLKNENAFKRFRNLVKITIEKVIYILYKIFYY